MDSPEPPEHPSEPRPEWEPLDLSYRLTVRTVLWVIAGAVLLGLSFWLFLT